MKLSILKKVAVATTIFAAVALLASCGGKKADKKAAKGADAAVEVAAEEEKVVELSTEKTKDPNPATDFIYETTVDGTGVVIQSYIGRRGNVIVPEEIEGYKVKVIGAESFRDTGISSVVLPASIKSIEASAFRGSKLKEITLNDGLQTIAGSAFRETRLSEITIPNGFEKFVGGYQFAGTNISKFTIPVGVTSIPEGCFDGCRLSEIEIISTITTIGNNAFANNSLKDVKFSGTPKITYGWNTFANTNANGTMTISLRQEINATGYKGKYYAGDISCCKEPVKK